jgi:hypothetical protein
MKVQFETLINSFLRTYRNIFTEKDFERMLVKAGIRISNEECAEYLESSSCVFALKGGLYITRAGAFTDRYFSFRPSRFEADKGIFAAGGRCMPFVDPEILPSSLSFTYKGEFLQKTAVEFDNTAAADLYALYGAEFASQYIAADPANTGMDLASLDFELPPKVKLTSVSLQPLIKYGGFSYGDRILCRVTDWDLGQIAVMPVTREGNALQINADDMARQNWNTELEKDLLESFDLTGPCTSIEEQLAVIFLDKAKNLCIPECGSVEELLAQSRKVGYEPFGVETRLWRSGEEVPAVGKWNRSEYGAPAPVPDNCSDFSVPDYILDAFIENQMYRKEFDAERIIADIIPDSVMLLKDERKFLLLHINSRHAIISKRYNWFADFSTGSLRQRSLTLYKKVSALVFEIDRSAADLEQYPQQELVILSQIFGHLARILEMIEEDPAAAVDEMDEIQLSLEGMESNFEGISADLADIIESEKRSRFVVI